MPLPKGWSPPDIRAMTDDQLRAHLEEMRSIGESYAAGYETRRHGGKAPITVPRGVRDMRIWRNYRVRDQSDEVPSDEHLSGEAADHWDKFAEIWQEDVVINPFPGGVAFEATYCFRSPTGAEVRAKGALIWYVDQEGRPTRLHEYMDSREADAVVKLGRTI